MYMYERTHGLVPKTKWASLMVPAFSGFCAVKARESVIKWVLLTKHWSIIPMKEVLGVCRKF